MIKIGAQNVFKIKINTVEKRKIPSIENIEEGLLLKRESLQQNFSFLSLDQQFRQAKKLPLDIHGRKRIYRVKTTILKPLCYILTKVFEGSSFYDENIKLTPTEFNLINVFIDKRFKLNLTQKYPGGAYGEKNVKDILTSYSKILFLLESNKREEENIKFVYKHTLKFLKSQFYEQNQLKYNKESEIKFYEHYFGEHAKALNRPLHDFFDPLNNKMGAGKKTKTLSVIHLKLTFACEKFKEAFFGYLQTQFRKDYQSSVYKKIEKIFSTLEAGLNKRDDQLTDKVIAKFLSDFHRKKRIKFPWCTKEIDNAVQAFRNRINKIKRKAGPLLVTDSLFT